MGKIYIWYAAVDLMYMIMRAIGRYEKHAGCFIRWSKANNDRSRTPSLSHTNHSELLLDRSVMVTITETRPAW